MEELISCVHCQTTLLLVIFLTDGELLPICASSFSASSAAFLSCDEIGHCNFQMGSHGRTQMSLCVWLFGDSFCESGILDVVKYISSMEICTNLNVSFISTLINLNLSFERFIIQCINAHMSRMECSV